MTLEKSKNKDVDADVTVYEEAKREAGLTATCEICSSVFRLED